MNTKDENDGRGLDEADAKHIANICSIASGLLASGHFTEVVDITNRDEPRARHWDAGKDWEAEGYPRRYPRYVAEEAVSIYREIIFEFNYEIENGY